MKQELIKIVMSDDIRSQKEQLFSIVPELQELDGFPQNNPYHIYDVFTHTAVVVQNTDKIPALRLAALFHDAGKPQTHTVDEKGIDHFYGHPYYSEQIFNTVANRLGIEEDLTHLTATLIRNHELPFNMSDKKIKKLIEELSPENIPLLFSLKRADILGQNPKYLDRLAKVDELEQKYKDISVFCDTPQEQSFPSKTK